MVLLIILLLNDGLFYSSNNIKASFYSSILFQNDSTQNPSEKMFSPSGDVKNDSLITQEKPKLTTLKKTLIVSGGVVVVGVIAYFFWRYYHGQENAPFLPLPIPPPPPQ